MPVNVPQEPKKYTTVYENFKGVDFTNDPSNVYRRRSPGGKNMLPDLDGRPYKRKGWKVEYSAQDFIDAAGSSATTVTPKRIHHFSLGGKEYLMLFNSLGVFYTAEDMDTVVKCQLATIEDDEIVTSAFPPQIDGVSLEADSGRTFFFESDGTAGLYTFVGTSLFRFDGQYYWEVDPYVPVLLVACDADGTGVLLDDINLLTTKRTVQYLCDGTTTTFAVPSGIDTTKEYLVETRDVAGDWEECTGTVSYSGGVLTITPAPTVVVTGEDNMRVTYYPANIATFTSQETLSANAYKRESYRVTGERRFCTPTPAGQTPSGSTASGTSGASSYTYDDAVFPLENPVNINEVTITPTGGTKTTNAYNNTVTYRPAEYTRRSGNSSDYTYQPIYIYREVTDNPQYTNFYTALLNGDMSAYTPIGTLYAPDGSYYSPSDAFASFTAEYDAQHQVAGKTYRYAYNFYYDYTQNWQNREPCTLGYDAYKYASTDGDETLVNDKSAFMTCQRATVYGSGLVNQVFMGASISNGYRSRMWYSAVGKPNYFPDTNYVEVGSNDTSIMGMVKCGEYLGIVKAGNALDSSIYLAYPTSFDDDTTYVVRQSIAGIGALSTGAFNILAEEPVFLSSEGVMAIELAGENRLRNRSYFIDKKLCAEQGLTNAVSYVFQNMYFLSINNHCYVLDGSQKSSWANEKTNLQYECYYLENVPAQCFGDMGGYLWFTDYEGNLCRFKTVRDVTPYRDEYAAGHTTLDADDVSGAGSADSLTVALGDLTYEDHAYTSDELPVGTMIHFVTADSSYSVTALTDSAITLDKGVPVHAVWDTISDDDGAIQFFKNLNKKGFVISLLPGSSSGVTVSLKPDEKDPIRYGTTDASGNLLPFDYFVRKKVKKYKRLQIICENNKLDQSFGVDQITKTYTVGNYSKNRK